MENSRKKIFIHNVSSKLSYHLVQALRDDHIKLENCSMIVGSASKQDEVHHAVYSTVSYNEEQILLGQLVMSSDLIVIDLRQMTQQAEYIIKVLEWGHRSLESKKKQLVIGIGSFMTWVCSKETTTALPISASSRSSRFPHHSWYYERELEKSLLRLSSLHSNINTSVITPGLLYGKDFPSDELALLIAQSWTVSSQVKIAGDGKNILPIVHIEDFCNHFNELVQKSNKSELEGIKQYISVDCEPSTLAQIAQQIVKSSGYLKQIVRTPLTYLTKQQNLISCNMHLQLSPLFRNLTPTCNSFNKYFKKFNSQPFDYLNLPVNHLALYTQEFEPENLATIVSELSTVMQVMKEEHVVEAIMVQKNIIQKNDVDIHEINHRIKQSFLQGNQWKNYIVVVDQILFDVEVAKVHNLVKFDLNKDLPALLRHNFAKYCLKTPHNDIEEVSHNLASVTNPDPKQQAEQLLYLQRIQQHTKKVRKEQSKMDQYLLDNLIIYISEALSRVKQSPGKELTEFIDVLKSIYERELNTT